MGDALFSGDPARQVTPDYYYSGGGGLIAVTDMASARAAIELISEQGEGITGHIFDEEGEIAHYFRFQQLLLGRYYREGDALDHPTGGPVEVDWDAVYPIKRNPRLADHAKGSPLREAVEGFNADYRRFLKLLTQAFQGEPARLVAAVGDMFCLKERFYQIMRHPLEDGSGLHAAPTFELDAGPGRTGPLPPTPRGPRQCDPGLGMTMPDMDDRFLALSAALTGFTAFQLQGTGQAALYQATASSMAGPCERARLARRLRRHRRAGSPADQDRCLRRDVLSDDRLGPLARSIIKMWYVGTWYELPRDWRERFGGSAQDHDHVPSPQSYTEGLLWPAVGANPQGPSPSGTACGPSPRA
jgi:hypothetical protein